MVRLRGDRVVRRELLDELLGLMPLAQWGFRLGAAHAGRSYAQLVEVAEVLSFPPPPPIGDLEGQGERWLARCGLA